MNQRVKETGEIVRDEAGKFEPGHMPVKPTGRPRGTSEIQKLRALVEPHKAEIVARLVQIAKSTDKEAVRAAEVLLERIVAKPRPTAELVHVEGLKEAKTLQGKADAIISAVATGSISAEAGRALLAMIDSYARAVSVDQTEQRLRALERSAGIRSGVIDVTPNNDSESELA